MSPSNFNFRKFLTFIRLGLSRWGHREIYNWISFLIAELIWLSLNQVTIFSINLIKSVQHKSGKAYFCGLEWKSFHFVLFFAKHRFAGIRFGNWTTYLKVIMDMICWTPYSDELKILKYRDKLTKTALCTVHSAIE